MSTNSVFPPLYPPAPEHNWKLLTVNIQTIDDFTARACPRCGAGWSWENKRDRCPGGKPMPEQR